MPTAPAPAHTQHPATPLYYLPVQHPRSKHWLCHFVFDPSAPVFPFLTLFLSLVTRAVDKRLLVSGMNQQEQHISASAGLAQQQCVVCFSFGIRKV